MTDHGHVEIETSGGYRPPTSGGDRMLIGLAALALVGGAVIGVGNLLTRDDEVAEASPAASASADPSRTPRPRPTATPFPDPPPEVAVVTGVPSSAPRATYSFDGWLRIVGDTAIHATPSDGSSVTGELHAADVVFGYDSGTQGWVSLGEGGYIRLDDPDVEAVESEVGRISGDVVSLAGGPEGLVALGTRPAATWYEQEAFVAASRDGARWEAREVPGGLAPNGPIAWGPAGWIGFATDYSSSRAWIGMSQDGRDWTWIGSLALPDETYPEQLVASDAGYLLSTFTYRDRSEYRIWFTRDGITWEERPEIPIGTESRLGLTAFRHGFLLWSTGRDSPILFSTDGMRWGATGTPQGQGFFAAPFGSGLRAVDVTEDGRVRAWTGSVLATGLRWRADPAGDLFEGATVTAMAGGSGQVVAVGFDRLSSGPLAWTNDGYGWSRAPFPDTYHGFPQQLAVGPSGPVVVGYRPTLRGDNPTFWRLGPSGWLSESEPLLEAASDPSAAECGQAPTDAIELWAIEKARAAACFGGLPITLRAWSARCDGCYGELPGAEPWWLAAPTTNVLYLAPSPDQDTWSVAVLDPSLPLEQSWRGHWLEVTGHFDDPAAVSCRYQPDPSFYDGYLFYRSQGSLVTTCRTQFVVTAVSEVDPP